MSRCPCPQGTLTAADARPWVAGFFAAILLGGCAFCPCRPAPGRWLKSALLTTWLAEHPIELHEALKAAELYRTPDTTAYLVQVRTSEPLHLHARHDLKVMLCRGRGALHLGPRILPMRRGDVAVIPRNTPHAFVNLALEPAALFVVFSPPFDSTDRVLLR